MSDLVWMALSGVIWTLAAVVGKMALDTHREVRRIKRRHGR